jgi:hypothetical protein
MGLIDKSGNGVGTDGTFERMLLESARGDGPPDGATRAAWSNFAEMAGAAGKVAAAGGVAGGATRAARGVAVKFVLLGAIAGSALTAAWMGRAHHASVSPLPAVSSAPAPSAVAPASVGRSPEADPMLARPALPSVDRSSSESVTAPTAAVVARPTRRGSADHGVPPSTLAAEVAALDAARTAIASGAFDESLQVVDRYHRDFPAGELAPDADVLAMEALASKGDRARVAERAKEFLARYPRDPHVARVRWLAAAP